jgi:hypothetical protein
MGQTLRAILSAGLLAAVLAAPASASIRDDCLQIAEEEEVPADDLEDFVAECIAMMEGDGLESDAADGDGGGGE